MRKWLMMIVGAVLLVLIGIGIYQTDASQKSQVLSEEDIIDLITSQYPGEISAITQQADRYQVNIEHEGAIYELIVDGYDGHVIELIENGTKTATAIDDTKDAESSTPEGNSSVASEEKQSNQEKTPSQEEASQETSHLQTSIMKHDTESPNKEKPEKKNTQDNKQTDKQAEKQPQQEDKAASPKEEEEPEPTEKEKKQEQQKLAVISEAEAGEIALEEFSGDIDELTLDENNDRLIYHIQVVREDLEAEMEMDAYSGEIIYIEIDD